MADIEQTEFLQRPTVAVIGGGSWATALAELLAEAGHRLRWWLRDPQDVAHILKTGRNPSYLPEAKVDRSQLWVGTDIQECVGPADLVLFVIPAAYIHTATAQLTAAELAGKKVASAIKGLEVNSGLRMAEFFAQTLAVKPENYAVVAGPSHAEEVSRGRTTLLTVGSADKTTAEMVAASLRWNHMHVVTSNDVAGLEFAGITKNIYAVGIGLALGLGYGDNYLAMYTANCLREMDLFLRELAPAAAEERHIADSAYLGDLLVTAYSQHSRNRTLGRFVGEGMTPQQALDHMNMVAEGYFASRLMAGRTRPEQLPIAHAVYRVLHEGADAAATLEGLLPYFR